MKPCKLFEGNITKLGYGKVGTTKYGTRLAHRVEYIKANGEVSKELKVLHHCDVRNCIELSHLYLGTQAQNVKDRVDRQRSNKPIGLRNGRARFTEKEVLEIRKSSLSGYALARVYGVGLSTIQHILHKRTWKHI